MMTIKPPKLTVGDIILKNLGKKRGMIVPKDIKQYDYVRAQKEPFLKALFRSRNKELPNGMIDIIQK